MARLAPQALAAAVVADALLAPVPARAVNLYVCGRNDGAGTFTASSDLDLVATSSPSLGGVVTESVLVLAGAARIRRRGGR